MLHAILPELTSGPAHITKWSIHVCNSTCPSDATPSCTMIAEMKDAHIASQHAQSSVHAELAWNSSLHCLLCNASLTASCSLRLELQCTFEVCTATKIKQLDSSEGALLVSQLYLQVVGLEVTNGTPMPVEPMQTLQLVAANHTHYLYTDMVLWQKCNHIVFQTNSAESHVTGSSCKRLQAALQKTQQVNLSDGCSVRYLMRNALQPCNENSNDAENSTPARHPQ